jgi:phage host-nuclease inhibitor protein Gam
MEAAVAEREVGMTEWNDGRLDDLSNRVDRIETKMDAGFARVDARFATLEAKLDKKLDGLQRSLIQIAWTFGIGMLTFAGALLGLIATKF